MPAAAGQIKVLSDLVLLFPADAIDIQVLTDLKIGKTLKASLQAKRAIDIKVLRTFSPYSCCASIDMQVLMDLKMETKCRKK